MGRADRLKPERLAEKLLAIRQSLDLTQEQLIERLGYKRLPLYPASISLYEQGKREPPLPVLLRYARLAGVTMEMLVDDELDLPKKLPTKKKSK
jgi:transcriptional regulator with XRE-family HTH domain